jgi:hypothetical protein
MNQILTLSLEKEIEGKVYRLALPIGVAWSEAISVIQEFGSMAVALAQQAEEAAKAQQSSAPAAQDPLEASAEPVQEEESPAQGQAEDKSPEEA